MFFSSQVASRGQGEKRRKRCRKIHTSHPGHCLFALRGSEPFIPPLVLWVSQALDSKLFNKLAANQKKGRKILNVPLRTCYVALRSCLLLCTNEIEHWGNSRGLLLSSDTTLCLCEIRHLCPNAKWSIACDRGVYFSHSDSMQWDHRQPQMVSLETGQCQEWAAKLIPFVWDWL